MTDKCVFNFVENNIDKPVHIQHRLGYDLYGILLDAGYEQCRDGAIVIKPYTGDDNIDIPFAEIRRIEPCVLQKKDNVNHPSHYQSKAGLEVIDIISAFTEDLTGEEAFCTGNAIKYICRWKSKNGVEDLNKAKWYIDRMINQIEKEKENHE